MRQNKKAGLDSDSPKMKFFDTLIIVVRFLKVKRESEKSRLAEIQLYLPARFGKTGSICEWGRAGAR